MNKKVSNFFINLLIGAFFGFCVFAAYVGMQENQLNGSTFEVRLENKSGVIPAKILSESEVSGLQVEYSLIPESGSMVKVALSHNMYDKSAFKIEVKVIGGAEFITNSPMPATLNLDDGRWLVIKKVK